jgi:FkbM family methyltransferase
MLSLEIEKALGMGWTAEHIRHEVLTAISFLPESHSVSPVCLDIGANIGLYTSAILNVAPDVEVHAFEPKPLSSRIMQDQFPSFSNVKTHSFALGEKIDQKSLYSNESVSPHSSLYLRNHMLNQIMVDQKIQVEF